MSNVVVPVSEPQVLRVTKMTGRSPSDPLRAVVEASINGVTLRGLKLELHQPHHWRLVPPGRKIQQHWQIVYDFSTRSVYDCLLRKVVTAYDEGQPLRAERSAVDQERDNPGPGVERSRPDRDFCDGWEHFRENTRSRRRGVLKCRAR